MTLLLPILPIAVIGSELGARHREDYSPGIVALSATVYGLALLFGLFVDTSYAAVGRMPRPPQRAGRVASVAVRHSH